MQFRISLIGRAQSSMVDVPVGDLFQLSDSIKRARFLMAETVQVTDPQAPRRILLAVHRIEWIAEGDDYHE